MSLLVHSLLRKDSHYSFTKACIQILTEITGRSRLQCASRRGQMPCYLPSISDRHLKAAQDFPKRHEGAGHHFCSHGTDGCWWHSLHPAFAVNLSENQGGWALPGRVRSRGPTEVGCLH